jgi:hypothetical protein
MAPSSDGRHGRDRGTGVAPSRPRMKASDPIFKRGWRGAQTHIYNICRTANWVHACYVSKLRQLSLWRQACVRAWWGRGWGPRYLGCPASRQRSCTAPRLEDHVEFEWQVQIDGRSVRAIHGVQANDVIRRAHVPAPPGWHHALQAASLPNIVRRSVERARVSDRSIEDVRCFLPLLD